MASTQNEQGKMPTKTTLTLSPLKRLVRKTSGAFSVASSRRKSSNKNSESTSVRHPRTLYKALRRSSNSSAVTAKSGVNRSTVSRRSDLDNAKKPALIVSKRGALIKRLNNSRLGTIRSGVDNRFRSVVSRSTTAEREGGASTFVDVQVPIEVPSKNVKQTEIKDDLPKEEIARQLEALFGRFCGGDYDMYLLLDERDKLLSKARVKTADVENAIVTQGTCTDMCPEKERYLRVVQKRISPYECDSSGTMVPDITVKDYSRSAADQEEPLPHELRPDHVLRRTMNYLIGKIAEVVPTKNEDLSIWYDFLWNRTRAIRKDITQQMMVNETAVVLNEQCARFHIFASHRLCKLDSNEFDQKMNTENLSKCLQSLRHLYEDLAKKGMFCESEAEFRSYDIMLNLADSYISRQVLAYRSEIRTSPNVKLALQLFSSFQSGNYRRFFKLLKEKANYLQCCICHRYFAEFRERSLSTIVEAFTASASASAKFPLRKLRGLLGFDDDEQTREVAKSYGFESKFDLDSKEEYLLLSRADFVQPKERLTLLHAWIEDKRSSVSLSQVLSGGAAVTIERWKPSISFQNGVYTKDPVVTDFLARVDTNENEQETQTVRKYSNSILKSCVAESKDNLQPYAEEALRNILDGALDAAIVYIIWKTIRTTFLEFEISRLFESSFEDVLKVICREAVEKLEARHRIDLAHTAEVEKKRQLVPLVKIWTEKLVDSVVILSLRSVYKKVYNEMSVKRKLKSLKRCPTRFYEELLTQVLNKEIKTICKLVFEEDVGRYKKCLEIRNHLDRLWLKQFFDQWRNRVLWKKSKIRKMQQLMNNFPAILFAKPGLSFRQVQLPTLEYNSVLNSWDEELEQWRLRRRNRIVKEAFSHWKQWTSSRLQHAAFLKDFVCTAVASNRKRHYPSNNDSNLSLRLSLLQAEKTRKEDDYVSIQCAADQTSVHLEQDVEMALRNIESISPLRRQSQYSGEKLAYLSPLEKYAKLDSVRVKLRPSVQAVDKSQVGALTLLQQRLSEFNKRLEETTSIIDSSTSNRLYLLSEGEAST